MTIGWGAEKIVQKESAVLTEREEVSMSILVEDWWERKIYATSYVNVFIILKVLCDLQKETAADVCRGLFL